MQECECLESVSTTTTTTSTTTTTTTQGICENPQNNGNGFCDDNNNVPECNYDGGDCCGSCVNKEYCSTCACLDGGSGNGAGNQYIGDGYCDDGYNNVGCQFDGGDCCDNNNNGWDDYCTVIYNNASLINNICLTYFVIFAEMWLLGF